MLSIAINFERLSNLFWEQVFEAGELEKTTAFESLRTQALAQEKLRANASISTGSIDLVAAWALFCAAKAIKPRTTIEVGTYIGRSTLAMALAMERDEADDSAIYTCDYSNSIDIKTTGSVVIEQFKRTGSEQMFETLTKRNIKADLIFLDGRLTDKDAQYLPSLTKSDTVYLLDDFEGIEKGVCNALKMAPALSRSHFLIYPPNADLLKVTNLSGRCTIGGWVPISAISLSRQ
jgi:predicted O-methyltransferase YrrM